MKSLQVDLTLCHAAKKCHLRLHPQHAHQEPADTDATPLWPARGPRGLRSNALAFWESNRVEDEVGNIGGSQNVPRSAFINRISPNESERIQPT